MNILGNRRGMGTIGFLFWLAVVFIVLHIAFKVGMEYFTFARMKDEMEIKASVAQVLKDDEILRDLLAKARDLELPLGPEDFILQREEDQKIMRIRTQWDREVRFLFGVHVRTFHFEPAIESSYAKVK